MKANFPGLNLTLAQRILFFYFEVWKFANRVCTLLKSSHFDSHSKFNLKWNTITENGPDTILISIQFKISKTFSEKNNEKLNPFPGP